MSALREERDHYRLLFEQSPQPMWVHDEETLEFLAVNEAAIARYGYSRDEFLRMRITDIRPAEDVPSLLEYLSGPAEPLSPSGVRRHRSKDGSILLVEIAWHPISFSGHDGRLVLLTDVTERERAFEELRRSQEAYERQYSALAALMHCGILQTRDRVAALERITQDTANALGVERVSVWSLTAEGDAFVAYDLFERSSARHSAGQRLEARSFPAYFRAVASCEVLVADDAERDPRARELAAAYLHPNGITSLLDAPIVLAGELAGVLRLEHVGTQRSWTAGERSFAMSAANLVALILSQHSLSESRAWVQTILDSEPEWVSLIGLDGRVLDINPAGLRMVEAADRASVLGREAIEVIHSSDRDAFLDLQKSVHAGSSGRLQFRIVGHLATERWVETHAAPHRGSGGEVLGMVAVTSDITQRRQSVEALRSSEERFRLLARMTSDAIYDWDISDNSVWWSEDSEQLFGLTRETLGSEFDSWSERIHPEDRGRVLEDLHRAVGGQGETFTAEYRFLHGDGSYSDMLDRGHILRNADGLGVRMIGGVSDFTERKRLEGEQLHSQRMESVGRLAGGIAHDFNNLLTVIAGTVDLALGSMHQEDPLRADLGEIRDAARRAEGLTRQLLAFSRRQVLQPRVLDLNAEIGGIVALLGRLIGEDIEIRFTPGADLRAVLADPGQIEQVLLNLAVNSRDAMPTGGVLSIDTRNLMVENPDAVRHSAATPGPHVCLTITDTGVGMDAATLEHAFEPFFTTKPAGLGTGLGLATVYGIVQQSGGSIQVQSDPGHGTSFQILLPRTEEAASMEALAQPGVLERGSETILLVEDDAAVRRLTERLLTASGYTVLAFGNGEKAMAEIVTGRGHPVHLLLTDVVMPRVNGPELARQVMERSPETRVLFMSGYTDDAIVRHGANAGGIKLLQKPFTGAELSAAVRSALSK